MTLLPNWFRKKLFLPSTDEDAIALVTIDHPDWDFPVRLSSHASETFSLDPLRQGTRHDGEKYDYGVLSDQLPSDADDMMPTSALSLDNIEHDLSALLDVEIEECTVTLKHVAKSSPETVLVEFPDFEPEAVTESGGSIDVDLTLDPVEMEPVPPDAFTPDTSPGCF